MNKQKKCGICHRSIETGELCPRHDRARQEIKEKYIIWKKAYGNDLDYEEYLSRLLELPEVGKFVKDYINFIRNNQDV